MRLEILLLLVVTLVNSGDLKDDTKIFIPTQEWREIPQGHSIPPGLHVRINLQTGKKEAKLLNLEENSDEKNSVIATSSVFEDDETEVKTETIHSRLKDALKNIPDEGFKYSEDELKELAKKFKSYETIKQEFDDINMKIKTDFEIMSDLFDKYETIKGKQNLHEFNVLFEDLEYLLHQIDNANDFVTAGGIEQVILSNLRNQSMPELRIHSVKLLGILVQNNPKGQIAAFEKNVGSDLLHLLAHASSSSTTELSSIIFALGGLLRKFPLAQEELLNNPGLKVLVDLLGKQVDYKIKIKSLLLLTDLLRDYDEMIERSDFNETNDVVNIKFRLAKTEYCTVVVELLSVHRPDYLENSYIADDILNVLIVSKEICKPVWSESPIFGQTLLFMKNSYGRTKGKINEDDGELSDVNHKLQELETFFSNHTIVQSKDLGNEEL